MNRAIRNVLSKGQIGMDRREPLTVSHRKAASAPTPRTKSGAAKVCTRGGPRLHHPMPGEDKAMSKSTTPNRAFHNVTDAMLADEIGQLNAQAKAVGERLEEAKAEFKARRLGRTHGERFTVTRSETVRWTLDSAAVKAEMGEAWVTARSSQTPVASLRITANVAALAVAAE